MVTHFNDGYLRFAPSLMKTMLSMKWSMSVSFRMSRTALRMVRMSAGKNFKTFI